jgi:hypothetical protein
MTKFENSWGIHMREGLAEMSLSQLEGRWWGRGRSVYNWLKLFSAKPSLICIPQLFSNLVIINLLAYEDGTDRVFRNVDI